MSSDNKKMELSACMAISHFIKIIKGRLFLLMKANVA